MKFLYFQNLKSHNHNKNDEIIKIQLITPFQRRLKFLILNNIPKSLTWNAMKDDV